MDLEHEQNIEHLRDVAILLRGETERLTRVIGILSKELDKATGKTDWVQQALALIAALKPKPKAEAKPAKAKKEPKPRSRSGPRPQSKLDKEQVHFDLAEDARICPECNGALREVSGIADVSECIDVIEVHYVLKTITQSKYRCTACDCLSRAPGPERAIPGGRYGLDVGIKVAIDKYEQHIPLARQARIMAGHGLVIGRNTLYNLIERLADELMPTWEAIVAEILAHNVIGLDQTGWPNLDKKGKKRWQVWCLTAPNLVAHLIRGDKSAQTFNDIVGDYGGIIVCDALSSHISAARAASSLYKLAGCWAHVRRKFAECEDDFPESREALTLIRQLYDIEEEATNEAERASLRSSKSAAVLAELKAWLLATPMPKTTSLGRAIRYTVKDWERLTVFLGNILVPLDNNATERGVRGIAIGRRVHFGSKSRRGTQVAAIYYTLVESAKASGVSPRDYIRHAVIASRSGDILTPGGYRAFLDYDEHSLLDEGSLAQVPTG